MVVVMMVTVVVAHAALHTVVVAVTIVMMMPTFAPTMLADTIAAVAVAVMVVGTAQGGQGKIFESDVGVGSGAGATLFADRLHLKIKVAAGRSPRRSHQQCDGQHQRKAQGFSGTGEAHTGVPAFPFFLFIICG